MPTLSAALGERKERKEKRLLGSSYVLEAFTYII